MYTAYGLLICSDLTLPEVPHFTSQPLSSVEVQVPDVVIKVEPTPDGNAVSPTASHDFASVISERNSFCLIRQDVAHLFWREAGHFQVKAGREILINPAPDADEPTLRCFLLGTVLAVLLHQRGFLMLHASAVALPDANGTEAAVAFLGHSGQGKSTMAAAMHAAGARFLADDVIAVPTLAAPTLAVPASAATPVQLTAISPDAPLIYPSYPQMRLWPQSVEALGENAQALPLVANHAEKRARAVPQGFQLEPLPLRVAYVLEEGPTPQCELLARQQALMNLINHSYCVRALPPADTGANFLQCAQLAKALPVYRLQRPRDLQQLFAGVQLVQTTMQAGNLKT